MSKLTIVEAVKVIPVSESKLRRDLKAGVLSFTTAKNGKKVIDTAELERAYGLLTANENVKNGGGGHDRGREITLLENQIADLRAQLARAESQLQIASTEKTKLLDLLSAEKDEKREMKEEMRALMPPPDEREQKPEQTQIKPRGWLQRLIGV